MDHARKIGKSDVKFAWSRKPSPPSSLCEMKPTLIEEPLGTEEDRRLANWRKWLKDREKHYRHYEKSTGRVRENLLMIHDADDFRQKVESRNIIEGAGGMIPSRIDKYRGNPGFWVTPKFLSNHGNPDLPNISTTLTRKQMGGKPVLERIALPELIKKEKGLPITKNKRASSWNSGDYLRKRVNDLSREIELLEAKTPDISHLVVKGEKLERVSSEKFPKLPIITLVESDVFEPEDVNQPEVLEKLDQDDVLIVQDRKIFFDKSFAVKKIDESRSKHLWSLIFHSTDFKACRREICLENRSSFAITYRWRYASLGTSFAPPLSRNSPFFFNKNKGLVLPRQLVRLPVWFRSRVPRTARDSWVLTTEPPICSEPMIFRFWGCAILSTSPDPHKPGNPLDNDCEKARSIEKYLDHRIRDQKIHEIIHSTIDNVRFDKAPSVSYKSLFLESDIFRVKNQTHHWHFDLIRELRDIYDDVTSNDSPPWSLSLTDLRSILLQIKNVDTRNEALMRFNDLCRDSMMPNLRNPMRNHKRSMVYNLLCCFANEFEAESYYVLENFSQKQITGCTSGEAPGDVSRPASTTRTSQISLTTPRKKTRKISHSGKSRSSSKTSVSTNNREVTMDRVEIEAMKKSGLYKEVFQVRMREMLSNTIAEICSVIDTMDNLNPRDKRIEIIS